jgi:hypothetical protein
MSRCIERSWARRGVACVVATVVAATAVAATAAPAAAQHPHCLTAPYSIGNISLLPVTLPRTFGNTTPNQSLSFVFDMPAPPPGTPTCRYEISDITLVALRLTTSPAAQFGKLQMRDVDLPGTGPVGGGTGAGTVIYTIPPHQTVGSFEIALPRAGFPILLTQPVGTFTITQASATIDGTHYFRLVPEPSALALAATGTLLLGGAVLRRRGRGVWSVS